ncbi:hypothetical protein CHM34_04230 [Paludifilum halophilum]|uniref:DUF3955 domain-containing protein n=1 Tax=Paludifilum halophilum TaxID=1642702 RepID=A0A235B9L2_9BACL|nr:hypothetical protein CHM34_04230 [Paludifilum halophilum]
MKQLIVGCTLMLAGILLYGLRWVAGAILAAGQDVGLSQGLSRMGFFPFIFSLSLIIIGLLFIIVSDDGKPISKVNEDSKRRQ